MLEKQSKQTIMKEIDKNTREYQELFYKFIQKNRVFYADEVRAWLRAYREEEISFSRFVEIMNEKVFNWYNSQNKSNE